MNRKYSFKISLFLGVLILSSLALVHAYDELSLEVPNLEKIIDLDNDARGSFGKMGVYRVNSGLDQSRLEHEFKDSLGKNGFLYRQDKEIRLEGSRRLRFDRDNLVIDINLFDLEGHGTEVVIDEYLASELPLDLKDMHSLVEKQSLGTRDVEIPKYTHYAKSKVRPSKALSPIDIPPPPDSKPITEDILSSCGSGCAGIGPGEIYHSKNTSKQVESFYDKFFQRNGFELRDDMNFRLLVYRRLRFERSDMAVEIYLISRADNSCEVKIVKYADRNETTEAEANPFALAILPREDNVDGSDFNDIPRPQGSVRWSGAAKNGNLSYLVPMTVSEARKFYLEEMATSGWKLIFEMDAKKTSDEYTKNYSGDVLVPSLFVGSRIDLSEIVKNSYLLDYDSDSSGAKIMIYQNYVSPGSGSIVDIFYAKKERRR
jgi:hypothetical protein